jgi:hypothetical protein
MRYFGSPAGHKGAQYIMEACFTFTQQRAYEVLDGRVMSNRIRKTDSIVAHEGVTRARPALHIFATRWHQLIGENPYCRLQQRKVSYENSRYTYQCSKKSCP